MPEAQSNPRFVLARTSHPGNIGSAARAIRTMGFERLELVNPARFPDPEAEALAVGAPGVLEHAGVHVALPDALAGCHLVMGLSARRRGISLPELTPREAAMQALDAMARGEQVAMLFGNESSGLDNQELAHCHAMVRIPSVEDFSSLNLAQAVQVMAYELRMASLGKDMPATSLRHDAPADAAQMEQFFVHLAEMLDAIDFHKGRSPETVTLRLRKLFQRARPDERELRILHGILSDAMRTAEKH
ncbi:MAG TPA: RNA methyltransferase [Oleiagrimonas sp.]|nr:RNA methyltransferase [Oleiagrimonas sp.]